MNISLLGILLLVVFLIHTPCSQEGYTNNNHPTDKPDDTQYYACHDYSVTSNLGNNNYKKIKHGIGKPLEGAYSYFLDTYGIRNYDELFHAPICDKHYNFKHISSLSPPSEIIDHTNILKQGELVNIENEYDTNAIKDPYYLYGNPNHIGNQLTYTDEINDLFLKNHSSHDAENLAHRLDYKTNQN
mgnify:CR=1 FL=1|tara:strand:+ start:42 stop:599 length:558 start_codon:yes stop_codon:yes gene_type:complete